MINNNQKTYKGIVYKSTGSWYLIKSIDNIFFNARIRGKIKLKNIRTTNPISVGDFVDYEIEKDNNNAWITNVCPRVNYIIRKSVNLSKESHIIASNIDLACIIFTLKSPVTSLGFLDRFLINCEAYNIKPLIIINKIDIFNNEELINAKQKLEIYTKIGYSIIMISAKDSINTEILKEKLLNKTTLFFGHSGSGKSTLINKIIPEINLKTAEISDFNLKGKHTTTFAQMYDFNSNSRIIDTPGIKEFGIIDFKKSELQSYFPEVFNQSKNCKFNNCVHINEPKCAVINAVNQDEISQERYNSYLSLLEECS